MTQEYEEAILWLRPWFVGRLPSKGPLRISRNEYREGVDRLPQSHKPLVAEAMQVWLDRGYELSYQQMNVAFFGAAIQCGLLVVDQEVTT